MKIGILAQGFMSWGGGIDFLRIVADSLYHADNSLEIHVFLPIRGPRLAAKNIIRPFYQALRGAIGFENKGSHRIDRVFLINSAKDFCVGIKVHEIDCGEKAIENACLKFGIDVLMPAMVPLSKNFSIPWVGYLYDFQHKYYPGNFSDYELKCREVNFSAMLGRAKALIVNAKSVARDIDKYHPEATAKIFAMPYSAAPNLSWFGDDGISRIKIKYGIGDKYFMICNQFWKHKDHATAIRAFKYISDSHPDLELVCTGSTVDYRDPGYFPMLLELIKNSNIESRVHVLGLIPKRDQISLLKHAVALIQPTLFEGGPGGGSVFDSVSLGIPSIVSDIDVNKEITDESVVYFRANNFNSLAQEMSIILNCIKLRNVSNEELELRGVARRRACGDVLLKAVEYVTG